MDIPVNAAGLITESALTIAGDGALDIQNVLQDIQGGSDPTTYVKDTLGVDTDTVLKQGYDYGVANIMDSTEGKAVLTKYGYDSDNTPNITQASGAMIIDDLMQKISTKVQVASQMLATVNNINKTASRVISQG